MRDHDPKAVKSFDGVYDRGEPESVPLDHFIDALNVRFLDMGVETREGSTLDLTTAFVVKRYAIYKRIGEAARLLLLDGAGNLYDSTNLVAPILSLASMSDFACLTLFNRAYISPHDGVRGIGGQSVQVYDGTTCRQAAGLPPSGFTLLATESGLSGSIDIGERLFAEVYETSSGFITAPGPAIFPKLISTGGKKADISQISIGPAGTIARRIVATKRLVDYNGQNNQAFFFVPNARIGNNISTTITVDFFDADLVSSADYLFDQLSSIPAGSFLSTFKGMLIVGGENIADSIFRASKPGEPESHDAVEGFGTVDPGDAGGPLTNAGEYRNQLIVTKGARAYVTQASSDGSGASFWPIDSIDQSAGAFIHGIAEVREKRTNLLDALMTADPTGLHVFRGSFADRELTWKIEAIWERITETAYNKVQVVVDSKLKRIYVTLPLDGAVTPTHILYGDYSDGLDHENIRWNLWKYPSSINSIGAFEETNGKVTMKFVLTTANVYKMDEAATNDFGNAIDSFVKLAMFRARDDESLCHFNGVRMRATGVGVLQINIQNLDATINVDAPSLVLSLNPGKSLNRIFNVTSEMVSPKVRVNGINEKFRITRFIMFVKTLWQSRSE